MDNKTSKVNSITAIGFLSIALVLSADQTGKDYDLMDALINYTDSLTLVNKAEAGK